ncbi:MAG TPA: class I SAM-dependent methyltransferase [Kofleriaceae bacterium]|nr:class I SAM-dependent methyltransferase [Kofleriaceae bacterium]
MVRFAMLAFLAGLSAASLGACGKGDAQADDHARKDPVTRPAQDQSEEARFDRERHPELIVEALGLKPGMVVADVGAGTGLLTVHLARAVAPDGKIVATDVDGAVLDMLQSRVDAAGLTKVVERRVVAGDAPGLEPGTYDAILLAQVDHLFNDRAAWLRAAIPALKPGGRVVIENRIYNRAGAIEGAQAAGLHLDRESNDVPGEFIATFSVPGAK